MTALGQWVTIVVGWTAVVFVIIIGPLAIQTSEKGPYFGISGYWFVFCLLDLLPYLSSHLLVVQVLDNRCLPRRTNLPRILLRKPSPPLPIPLAHPLRSS